MSSTNNEHRQHEAEGGSALPSHLSEFIDLSRKLDENLKKKDSIAETRLQNRLRIFYATLTEDQKADIQMFIERERAGMRIEAERSRTNRALHAVLRTPVLMMGALAETVPQFTGKTLELIIATLGLSAAGIVKGARTTYRAFKKAA